MTIALSMPVFVGICLFLIGLIVGTISSIIAKNWFYVIALSLFAAAMAFIIGGAMAMTDKVILSNQQRIIAKNEFIEELPQEWKILVSAIEKAQELGTGLVDKIIADMPDRNLPKITPEQYDRLDKLINPNQLLVHKDVLIPYVDTTSLYRIDQKEKP